MLDREANVTACASDGKALRIAAQKRVPQRHKLLWRKRAKHMRLLLRSICWIVSGALVGFGMIAFGLGLLPALLGVVLAIYGLRKFGREGFWLTVASMGALPASILTYIYVTRDPSSTYFGPEDRYFKAVGLFVLIMLVGLIWGAVEVRRGRTSRPR